jgi:putative membrane protein
MNYLLNHWSFDPFAIVVMALVALHEIGLHRLGRRASPERRAARRRRSLLFYAGLAVLLISVMSPIDYWASDYFFVHMLEHILIMFYAPILIVAGAPWMVLLHAFPLGFRRGVGRAFAGLHRARPLRGPARVVGGPVAAIVVFNAVMVFWHIPGPFDLAENNELVHIWLMHASFLLAGVWFWMQIITSHPFHARLTWFGRMAAIFWTNIVMWVLAMALSIFSSTSWYAVYAHHPGVTMSPFAGQQIGAAILWVCGDFWAIPAMVVTVHRAIQAEGGLGMALDRMLRRRRMGVFGDPAP